MILSSVKLAAQFDNMRSLATRHDASVMVASVEVQLVFTASSLEKHLVLDGQNFVWLCTHKPFSRERSMNEFFWG